MKQIVLQQPDYRLPTRQIARQHAVQIQKAHDFAQISAGLEKTEKTGAVGGIGIKAPVQRLHRCPPRPQRFRRHTFHRAVELPARHHTENLLRPFLKQLQIAHGNLLTQQIIVGVDFALHPRQRRIHPTAQHRNQNAVELDNGFHRAVKAVHQLFHRRLPFQIGITAAADFSLQIEYQPLFGTAGSQM